MSTKRTSDESTDEVPPLEVPPGPAYVESPHGSLDEGWSAVHGDQNVAADSDSLSNFAADRDRGLHAERDNRKARLFRQGISIADEREDENRAAAKVARAEKVQPGSGQRRTQRQHRDDPDASEPQV